ncbi:Hypothetical protein ORPV_380 [Orpheovirus IHUMI-LCC2]|uniref:Uncharacterized protein n=1 Tax=Orpheovirus IHUMI-LCC2 TaxID=2023057 RepID=A0A2I2L426_9VIRU|nr:Hypothetical protein ORPV_380 [Orpheovirus IHUMI-LCC2]SNW62284.1 Hypothetical protein ORPV_380 [Orpheovirus IHUMI-LCC2]
MLYIKNNNISILCILSHETFVYQNYIINSLIFDINCNYNENSILMLCVENDDIFILCILSHENFICQVYNF